MRRVHVNYVTCPYFDPATVTEATGKLKGVQNHHNLAPPPRLAALSFSRPSGIPWAFGETAPEGDVPVIAKTVADLFSLSAWPPGLILDFPSCGDRYPESIVVVERVSRERRGD